MFAHWMIRIHTVFILMQRGMQGVAVLLLLMSRGRFRLLQDGDETMKYISFDGVFTFEESFNQDGNDFTIVGRL